MHCILSYLFSSLITGKHILELRFSSIVIAIKNIFPMYVFWASVKNCRFHLHDWVLWNFFKICGCFAFLKGFLFDLILRQLAGTSYTIPIFMIDLVGIQID
jgi:hypothetical protein